MIALVYNNKAFKIQDEYTITNSTNEVTFSDITIDFTGKTLADIPFKYQKMEIRESKDEADILNGELLFTGYLDEIKLPDMKQKDEYRTLEVTLLSPLKMATVRTVSLIGTYETAEAITRVLDPLISDGFILKELEVGDGQITTNFLMETVENCMNNICSKKNIFWYINEKREIFIYEINYMLGRPSVMTIDENTKLSEIGLDEFSPNIESIEYSNIINFKNVRLVYEYIYGNYNEYPIMTSNKTLHPGDVVTFDRPIVIDEELLRNVIDFKEKYGNETPAKVYLALRMVCNQSYYEIGICRDKENEAYPYNEFFIQDGITFSDDDGEEGEIVLQRDNFFRNLITGVKYNGHGNDWDVLLQLESLTALRYTIMKFVHAREIENLKGLISDSGQVERTIDMNNVWMTYSQLIDYAKSLIVQNSNIVNEIKLHFTKNPNLKIADIVQIKMKNYYCEGIFAVTNIEKKYINDEEVEWSITLKNSNFTYTYIDMFRPQEAEETESITDTMLVSNYVEDGIVETHTIKISGEEQTNEN